MQTSGAEYENIAASMLAAAGLPVLCRNFRTRSGEIDIIAQDGPTLVFVEVRQRSHTGFAGAAASVDRRKQQRLLRTAALYLRARHPGIQPPCRFDVIAFEPPQSGRGKAPHWIKGAFTA